LAKIQHILLGDNPFFGVDHLSQERARQKARESQNFGNMLDVICYSLNAGVKGMVASTHPKLKDFIDFISTKSNVIGEIEFYPIVPYIQGYVLKLNEKGMIRTLMDTLNPPTNFQNKLKILTKSSLGAIRKDIFALFKAFIDIELAQLHSAKINTVFLHDVLTDLALSLNIKEMFEIFQVHLHDEYGLEAGLVTKNFPLLVAKLDDWNSKFSLIMTSFNRAGFQMNPSKEACEKTLVSYGGNLIAMSVLAGGFLRPKEARDYIFLQPKIDTMVIGISSTVHAKDTFELFLDKKRID